MRRHVRRNSHSLYLDLCSAVEGIIQRRRSSRRGFTLNLLLLFLHVFHHREVLKIPVVSRGMSLLIPSASVSVARGEPLNVWSRSDMASSVERLVWYANWSESMVTGSEEVTWSLTNLSKHFITIGATGHRGNHCVKRTVASLGQGRWWTLWSTWEPLLGPRRGWRSPGASWSKQALRTRPRLHLVLLPIAFSLLKAFLLCDDKSAVVTGALWDTELYRGVWQPEWRYCYSLCWTAILCCS